MKDLGYTPDMKAEPVLASDKPKVQYPTVSLSEGSLDKFLDGEKMPSVGDEFEMTVKFRVTGISDNEWGKRLEMSMIECDCMTDLETEDEEDEGEMKEHSGKRYSKAI